MTSTALGGCSCSNFKYQHKCNDEKLALFYQAELTKQITAQVKKLSDDEDEKAASDSDSPNYPYDQAKALGKPEIDMDRISAGLPCGSESFLLMFARWKKLERDLYNERKKYVFYSYGHPLLKLEVL